MTAQSLSFLRNRSYLSAAGSHFFIDVMNSGRVVLIAILAVSLGLTNTQVGLLLLVYSGGSSLLMPYFGWLADRFGARWPIVLGLGWMIVLYSLAAFLPGWPALIAVTLASLGSGAFHPSGTKVASLASDERRTQATALFFMAGQFGLFAGPVLAGLLLSRFGRSGYLALTMMASVPFFAGWLWLADPHEAEPATTRSRNAPVLFTAGNVGLKRTLAAIVVVIIAYNTVSFATQNFAPKLFTELGYAPDYVGWIAGLFMMGSAIGGLVGGSVADRIGGRSVVLLAMLGVIIPIYAYIPVDDPWRLPLLLLAGFFGGMPHSILVLMVQSLLPGRRALASGLTLGFMFFSGAVGSTIMGVIADRIGLALALQGTALLPLAAAGLALLLPRRRAGALVSHHASEAGQNRV